MTKTLTVAALLLFTMSCNNAAKDPSSDVGPVATAEPAATAPHEYAAKASYSSSFELGDPKQADIVIDLWQQFDANKLEDGLKYFADTVDLWTNDGWRYRGPKDSLMDIMKKLRGTYSTVKSDLVAIIPLKSIDKDENWVAIYGTEFKTIKNKVDSTDIQENWRFNKDGKINMMHAYQRKK